MRRACSRAVSHLATGCTWPGAEYLLCAGSIEQARLCFRFTRADLEPTGEYRFLDSATRIGITHRASNTRLRVLSSNGRTAMGIVGCPLLVADEPGSWEVVGGELTLRESLAMLVEREVSRKDERRIEMALKIARFPMVRELADFDFKAQPSVDPRQVRELATSRWVAHGDALLVLGPPGVGKTHLAVALGREAIRQSYSTLFTTAQALMAALVKAHSEGRLDDRLAFYSKPKLLICDEMGYLPFEAHAAHLFFQLVSRRYERGSMLITSNRSVGEWGEVFGDAVVATAILDRLLHHSHVLTITGESYRLREKRRAGALKFPAPKPVAPPTGSQAST